MRILGDYIKVAQALARGNNRWVLFVNFGTNDASETFENHIQEVLKAAPYLPKPEENMELWFEGKAYILCDSQEECERLFNQTVGDDGPTETNPYKGNKKVFASTWDNRGNGHNENT